MRPRAEESGIVHQPPNVSSAGTVSALIVDETTLYREFLADALLRAGCAVAVRTAENAESAVHILRSFQADVVLVAMTSPHGLATIRAMREAGPIVQIVALAVSETEDEIVACVEAGVSGFLGRSGDLRELKATIDGVVRGDTVCSSRIAGTLVRRVYTLAAERERLPGPGHLTPRERQVLVLIERGCTNQQIASELRIELRTVKNHVHNILDKLRVKRRGEAAARLRSARVPQLEVLHGRPRRTRAAGVGDPVSKPAAGTGRVRSH